MNKILLDLAPIPEGSFGALGTPGKIAIAAGIVLILAACGFIIYKFRQKHQ